MRRFCIQLIETEPQLALIAEEKSPTRICHRGVSAINCSDMEVSMEHSYVDNIIKEIPEVTVLLKQNKETEGYQAFNRLVPDINNAMTEFIELIPKLQTAGIDIPQDVILKQISNMAEGYEYRDNVLLADTLDYEILDTLQLYVEILEQL